MASWDLPKSPNVFHPEKPSAVGSRNSLAQEFRDQQAEVDLLLSEEVDKVMNHITGKLPQDVAHLLDAIGGMDKFNTGEIEKSIVNMYGHLHGHIQRGVNDLENLTNSLLRQKTDVGAFIRGQTAYSIVKCSFKDSLYKPKTVSDVKLSV